MRKFVTLLTFMLIAATFHGNAQTLNHTVWKAFLAGSLNDTVTLRVGVDTCVATNSGGDILVRSIWKINKDTLTIHDIDGQYPCTDSDGVYQFTLSEGDLSLNLIRDLCDGRASAINGVRWIKG